MTDKTKAQPEALRLELHQECAGFATSLRSAANVVQLQGQKAPPSFLKAADIFERAALEIQQLKAQLSARQAAPDWIEDLAQSWDECMYDAPGEMIDIGASIRKAASRAAPPPPEREPQKGATND